MARAYRSDLRTEQARGTRRTVVDAARALFVDRGYDRTTLDAVAAAAGVSRRTVVNAVGGKAALLKLAWDQALAGDDEPVPMADRPAVLAILACTDPAESFRRWAAMVADVTGRAVALHRVLTAAADVDPDAAELLVRSERERLEGARAFARHLASIDGLAVPEEAAADAFWALNGATLYRDLVLDRGWSVSAFVAWLAAQAAASAGRTLD